MEEHATILQDLFCLGLWIVLLLTFGKGNRYPYTNRKSNILLGVFLIALFSVFSYIDGDFFNYKLIYNDVASGISWHFEEVYFWIINNVAKSYFDFRVIVWGGATLLLFWAYRRVSESVPLALFIFVLCYLPWFAYARASVSMALILLGTSFFYNPIKGGSLFSKIIGIAIVCSAFFFHQSAIIGIVAALASFFMVRINKKYLIAILVLIPLVVLMMGYFLESISLIGNDSLISQSAINDYFNTSSGKKTGLWGEGMGFILQNLISLGGLYLTAALYVILVFNGSYEELPKRIRAVASYVFVVVLIAFGFALNATGMANVLHYRIMYFAMPANAVFLASVKIHRYKRSFFKLIYIISAFGAAYNLFYSFYRCLVFRSM